MRTSIALIFCVLYTISAQALRVKDEQVILDKLDDYNFCQTKDYSGDWCYDAIKRWVVDHPADSFEAGKLVRKTMNHWAAMPFFATTVDSKSGHCTDKDVHLAVMSALDLPADNYKDVVRQAKDIGLEKCFKEMKAEIVKEAAAEGYLFTNTCHELVAKKLLSGAKATNCK
jgi:hypothetical protein